MELVKKKRRIAEFADRWLFNHAGLFCFLIGLFIVFLTRLAFQPHRQVSSPLS